jgi:hypothetical protein
MSTTTPFPTSNDMSSSSPRDDDEGLQVRSTQTPPRPLSAGDDASARHGSGFGSDEMNQQLDHLRQMGDEWTQSLRTTVRDNPLASVAVAVAVGMLLSRISR